MDYQESKIMASLNKVAQCLIVNACWLIACIPIFTIGAATTAMYSVTQKNLLHDREYPFHLYWQEFRKNFKSATILWVIEVVVAALAIYDISYLYQMAMKGEGRGLLYLAMLVLALLFLLTALYCFGYIARFENTLWKSFRSSFLIMLMHPFGNLALLALAAVFGMLIYFQVWLILLLPVMYMIVFVKMLEKSFYRLMTEEQKAREDRKNHLEDDVTV